MCSCLGKSHLPAAVAGKEMISKGVGAAPCTRGPLGIVCLLGPLSVCLSMQPGVGNPRAGPDGRRDAIDRSQRFLPALSGVRLHHHPARRNVRESLYVPAQ